MFLHSSTGNVSITNCTFYINSVDGFGDGVQLDLLAGYASATNAHFETTKLLIEELYIWSLLRQGQR